MSTARSSHEAAPPAERDLAAALHEISNALTVVLGWLEEARLASEGNARAERAIDIALSRALAGRDLARRAIGAKVPFCEEEGELESLVHDAARGVEKEAARHEIAISVRVGPHAREARLRDTRSALQVLTNLLLNAIAMGSRSVVIEATLGVEDARIRVTDDGPGIDPSRHDTIFDGTHSSRPGGAGLGLRHARALAREKGGELSLLPATTGAQFELAWPVAPPASETMPSFRHGSLDGMRILVLDDDDVVLELLTTALGARDAEVLTARRVDELEPLLAQPFDAALLDLSPIGRDALLPLVQRIRDRSPEALIVLISGSAGMPEAGAGLAHAWVRKPFEIGEILSVLKKRT